MEVVLLVVGIVLIVSSVIAGVMSGEFILFVTFLFSGVLTSLIFFGLSKVISNQERMIQLAISNQSSSNYIKRDEVECKNCGKLYGDDRSSCPYCGNRD